MVKLCGSDVLQQKVVFEQPEAHRFYCVCVSLQIKFNLGYYPVNLRRCLYVIIFFPGLILQVLENSSRDFWVSLVSYLLG